MSDPVVDGLCIRERVARIRSECDGVWAQCGIDAWSREFLDSIETRHSLTERQEATLAEIERKAFGE